MKITHTTRLTTTIVAFVIINVVNPLQICSQTIQSPKDFLGYQVGADFHLAPWDSIVTYFNQLGKASNRINVQEIGKTTLGKPMLAVLISDPATINNLAIHKENQHKIADPRLIQNKAEEKRLIQESKPVVLVNCQIHSTEAAASQMSMELAYDLATKETPEVQEILNHIIIVLIPCANPDGQQMVAEYYKKTLGKPWEGSRMPWLYHKYSGHDNNRDWFMLNLKETQLETNLLYHEWFPTVLWDIHQTRKNSYRLFVPPFYDPKNPEMHPVLERMLYVAGGQMAAALTVRGKTGVIQGVQYDNWWAGGFRTTPQRHNILGLLTEAASVNIASPVFLQKADLKGSGRGMPSYRITVNFPDPWPGGWWHLRDIVDYEKIAAMSLFTFAARYHDVLQKNYIQIGRGAIEKGKSEPPFAWIVPIEQKDPQAAYQMLKRLHATGIEVHQAEKGFIADGTNYSKGTFIMYCAQPYRPHLMDMMERQYYPNRLLYPGGPAEPPYDNAGWTFPLLMGVKYVAVKKPFRARVKKLEEIPFPQGVIKGKTSSKYFLIRAGSSDDFRLMNRLWKNKIAFKIYTRDKDWQVNGQKVLPGAMIIPARAKNLQEGLAVDLIAIDNFFRKLGSDLKNVRAPKIALYQPWTASMDEGWTRYVLDDFEFRYTTIHNYDIRAGNLYKKFDCIILPSLNSKTIIKGRAPDTIFPEYVGGIGNQGIVNLQEFVENGGTLICNDASSNFAIQYFRLPVKNLVAGLNRKKFYCPGSILRLAMDVTHPLGFGMPKWYHGYFTRSQAFTVIKRKSKKNDDKQKLPARYSAPIVPMKTTVVSRYSDSELLESGWIFGGDLIAGKPAIVEVNYGKGHIELLGIRVQNRAQPHGTFRILFNAITRSVLN